MNTVVYNRVRPGPDPDSAFRVTTGLVAVVGLERTVVWPAGLVWPGAGLLPEPLMIWLAPTETHLTPESQWEACEATERDIEVAAAVVLVQRIQSRGPMIDRLTYLASMVDPDRSSQYTVASLLGTTREALTKNMTRWREEGRQAAD